MYFMIKNFISLRKYFYIKYKKFLFTKELEKINVKRETS